ncbi:mucin-19-like [Labrus mixtus]|uniref:mucin-19-like n=1 Tax=Labrus mixtus TaxID=508554 RepID=UPI0029C03CD7|nr:mucin-19-like [Labrus mixtus]
MTLQPQLLAVCFSLASVLGTVESVVTAETQKFTCRTFGSGVVQPFYGSDFYVRSNCPFTLTRFTHNRVECDITIQRDDSGLVVQVEIIINKIRTVVRNANIWVEKNRVSLPYDHTYQHIFQYGIYTKLKSSLLPLSVTWHNVLGGIDTVWVELDQELSIDMTGLCGKSNVQGDKQQSISESVIADDTCQIRDPASAVNSDCRYFLSFTLDCLQEETLHYIQLCEENIYGFKESKYISCAFFKEIITQCGNSSFAWDIWRTATKCEKPNCPGDLDYVEKGAAFVPTCTNPNPTISYQDLTSSCVCPKSKVLNDHTEGFQCVSVSSCPCEFAGKSYTSGELRSTKCQSCLCSNGKWQCSENMCPSRCLIEGHFVTTFDGKHYVLPGKCTYVASQGQNWAIVIEFSAKAPSMKMAILQIFQETYTFSHNMVTFGEEEVTELHQTDHALVFWQSSMYVQVHTTLGINIQVQMFPEIQLYVTSTGNHKDMSGLCGNNNNDTTDDFTTSSGIVENSPQPFALSWSIGACPVNIPPSCIKTEYEIFADEKCSVLNIPSGIFSTCHAHIPTDYFYEVCIQRTCNCASGLQQCLCLALGSYVKACSSLGVEVGDWRKATNCTVECQNNQEFSYNIPACNRTCGSLSGPDPRCELDDAPVEGCGCPEGTHLNQGHICTPKAGCHCHFHGGSTPPGPVVIDGRQCSCDNGKLKCSEDCGCRNGKVCVHCSEDNIKTAQKTCDSLSKPMGARMTCENGCYCPYDQYEDHRGNCVSLDECTCVYSGKVFGEGQSVKTNCKTCTCGQGQWHCKAEPCSGRCQVYGNGHYQTFDSKWYRFDGNCQYTLVEDDCGKRNSTFSVRVESVPCCDEALTCSRSIIIDLQGKVTLTLSDIRVTRQYHGNGTQEGFLYSIHTVGLYIIISVPSKGITLIWDKHTRITVELSAYWKNKVCGLCGNFDSNEMNDLQIIGSEVMSSPLAFGNSWKAAAPPCSDVTTEIFPCERNSYCAAWAERRCMIITGNIFKDCHYKVDPLPYFHACVQESCSCEFEGKFLGFCTAVAAYAEACSDHDVCVNWRTPDLCPVYCDYYNEKDQCSWHYEACGQMLTCGRSSLPHKLEGCYPRCSKDAPYYDENVGECTKLNNCTCYFNDTVIQPGAVVVMQSISCLCVDGAIHCLPPPTTTTTTPTTAPTTADTTTAETTVPSTTPTISTTAETTVPSTTPTTAETTVPSTTPTTSTTAETTVPSTTSTTSTTPETTVPSTTPTTSTTPETTTSTTPETTVPSTTPTTSTTAETTVPSTTPTTSTTAETTVPSTTSTTSTTAETTVPSTTSTTSTTAETTVPSTTSTTPETTVPSTTSTTPETTGLSTTTPSISTETFTPSTYSTLPPTTTVSCECEDLKRKRSWTCNEMWTEDCFNKICLNGKIELTPVVCPDLTIPECPRQQLKKVLDGCCETWKCDCRCDLYGDPHYITFQGVPFDFLNDCSYILVEERSPRHHLTIAVDNFFCIPGLDGSCVKGIILKYQNSTATLKLNPPLSSVQATLNNMTIEPPYEEHGWRFEFTGYTVSIYLPEIRSYVSLSASYNLVINLAMEHFLNNTQGQCGVCGGGSCIRKGGLIEDDSCCEKTSYDWLYDDPQKPACFSAPRNVPCHPNTPSTTPFTTTHTTLCPASLLCELLDHPVFSNCSQFVNLIVKKKNCEFDSCRIGACASLEQAAEECKRAGFCIDWRRLTNGICDLTCQEGLVFRECQNKLDDFCYRGEQYNGTSLENNSAGCFCPSGLIRMGNHSNVCVSECPYCKGPLGEPKLPGEVWQSGCHLCTCNIQTRTEDCFRKPLQQPPTCGPDAELFNTSCCGEPTCVEKTCIYNGKTYKVGDRWNETTNPCMSFTCHKGGIQTETKVCPINNCQEEDQIWDDQHCCFTCNQSCSPKLTSINITIDNCTTIMQMSVCQGQCVSQPRVVLHGDLQVEQEYKCCQERSSERRSVTLQCLDLSARSYTYKHITSCECRACHILN